MDSFEGKHYSLYHYLHSSSRRAGFRFMYTIHRNVYEITNTYTILINGFSPVLALYSNSVSISIDIVSLLLLTLCIDFLRIINH